MHIFTRAYAYICVWTCVHLCMFAWVCVCVREMKFVWVCKWVCSGGAERGRREREREREREKKKRESTCARKWINICICIYSFTRAHIICAHCTYEWVMPHFVTPHSSLNHGIHMISHVVHTNGRFKHVRKSFSTRVYLKNEGDSASLYWGFRDVISNQVSCVHTWISHTYKCLESLICHVAQTNGTCHVAHKSGAHVNGSCHAYEWVMSHIWMGHVAHMNESCCMSQIWMCHVAHVNESRHTREWVMSHLWMSHVTPMNESYHTYEWVMSHLWMSHVTPMNESCHTW